jgi:hypothetical protein
MVWVATMRTVVLILGSLAGGKKVGIFFRATCFLAQLWVMPVAW